LQEETDDSVLLRFEVKDSGIGIEPDAIQRLFHAFEQADNSTSRKYGGTGLGLMITRRIAELMGGEAGVQSTPGVGSTFWFTARLIKGQKQNALITPLFSAAELILRERHVGRRVLIVDDDPLNLEIAKSVLEDVGMRVDTANDGIQAIQKISETEYAVILMDMQMPNLDGLAATQQIRRLPNHRKTPVLAMTANVFSDDRARCLAAGMNDFIAKPYTPEELYAILLKSLGPAPEQSGVNLSLQIGVPSIDQAHLEFVQQLDRLVGNSDAHPGTEVFSEVLSWMGGQIATHFTNEEVIIKLIGMPAEDVASHIQAHSEIHDQYTRLSLELMQGKLPDRVDVLQMIKGWTIDHVVFHDLKMKPYLLSCGATFE
jgi:hemerythrin-like metal-binding protein